jgi:UDP-N-acetylmuramyl pentapeptide phosphotransferase/UDP-N-acetylglucosamine-1-phosphate transferase
MSADNKYTAATFSIGGCFIIIAFIFTMASALSLVGNALDYFIEFLVIAALVGMIGFYNAYRAMQETIKKN